MAASKRRKKPLHRKPARRERADRADAARLVRAETGERNTIGILRDKVAVITGASRGIGLALAEAFAAAECDLVLAARDVRRLRNAAAALTRSGRVRVIVKSCDVRDPKQVAALFAAVKQRFPRIDILVNNAGIAHHMTPVPELSVEKWNEVIATNLTGMFLCSRSAIPWMSRGGVIVNNLSVAATGVFAGEAAYCASKWGALGLTNTLREELREKGIRVVALIPGPTDTEIWNQFWPEAPRDKMMRPEDVAKAVLTAVTMPAETAIDEIRMGPATGSL
jgi:NAD(P)-dependent dehydrogenase (short-subunit alcohol dehydrogenase family)